MTNRTSGRNLEVRRRILITGVLLTALLTSARAFQLGVMEGDRWRAKALDQQGDTLTLPAPRGTIYDRDGLPLAATHEVYSIAVAPRELEDRTAAAALLRRHLGLSRRQAEAAVDMSRKWVVLPGRYGGEAGEALSGVTGVYAQSVLQRFYPNGSVARELLGPVRLDGKALGGLELEFDSVLSGRPGRALVRRDSRGRQLPGAMLRAVEPTPGRDVYLTIDYDLQEIAEQALVDAVLRTEAAGGELLLADPRTGEILAAVSRGRDGRARNWRAVTEPYEPGSTLKPFTTAALLRLGRASLADSVYAEGGHYEALRLTDVHGYEWLTLGEALRQSSNIALAKMAARLAPAEHFVSLRDFGFGSPTGVSYPTESAGRVPPPSGWTKYSSSRLSIGYEISATPLQMAMAYGALANGGELLEPRLVREVRSRDGRVQRSFQPRVVRRVISSSVAEELKTVLVDAVETGTGQGAGLGTLAVAGKTGTARIAANGGYRAGAYTASFAGFFPAQDPQLVIIVKLDEPRGEYYGGLAAAPVTRATLEAVLAARSTPLDTRAIARPVGAARSASASAGGPGAVRLAADVRTLPSTSASPASHARTRFGTSGGREVVHLDPRSGAVTGATVMRQAVAPDVSAVGAGADTPRSRVPDVTGMPMRDGVRRLHGAGFRVRAEGSGRVLRTEPSADSDAAAPGTVIRVIGEVVS